MIDLCNLKSDRMRTSLAGFHLEKHPNVWIAGGAVRDSVIGDTIKDIDVFGTNAESLDKFIEEELKNYTRLRDTELLKEFKQGDWRVQVVYRFYVGIKECLDSFDFTICQFAYDGDKVFTTPESITDSFRKRLVVHSIQKDFTMDSFRRVVKYVKKGYTICNGGLLDVARSIQLLSPAEMEDQIIRYPDGTISPLRFD